jgi:hypothetical protein
MKNNIKINNQITGIAKYLLVKQAQQHFIPQYFPPQFMAGPHGVIFSGPYHPFFVPMSSMAPVQHIVPSPPPVMSPSYPQKGGLGSKILSFALKYALPMSVIGAVTTYVGKKWGESGSLGGAFKSIWGDIKGMFKKEGE